MMAAWPTSSPSPGRKLSTPGGSPASRSTRASCQCDDRRLLGRLQDDRVARHEGGHGHAGGDRQGKVPRRNDHGHARAEVLGEVRLTGGVTVPRLGQADHLASVKLAKVDGLGNVGIRFGPRFAAFENLPGGQLEAPAAHDRRRFDQDGRPIDRRRRRPGREGRAGRGDRRLGMLDAGQGGLAHHPRALTGLTESSTRSPVSTSWPSIKSG